MALENVWKSCSSCHAQSTAGRVADSARLSNGNADRKILASVIGLHDGQELLLTDPLIIVHVKLTYHIT